MTRFNPSILLATLAIAGAALLGSVEVQAQPKSCSGAGNWGGACAGPVHQVCVKWVPCRWGSKVSQYCAQIKCVPFGRK